MKVYDDLARRRSRPAVSPWAGRLFAGGLCLALLAAAGCAHPSAAARATPAPQSTETAPPAALPVSATAARAEQIRTDCIQNRRLICGKVLAVLTNGLVVESGYAGLLRPGLTGSWVIPGSVVVSPPGPALERNEPGTLCVGTIFLTDLPKRPPVKSFDYVVIMGYPAGRFIYRPAPGIEKVLRRFAAGLETATRLRD